MTEIILPEIECVKCGTMNIAHTVNEWISCSERMPPDLYEVMFFYIILNEVTGEIVKKDIICGHYEKDSWHICYLFTSIPLNERIKVTHWMELPEYPIKHWKKEE